MTDLAFAKALREHPQLEMIGLEEDHFLVRQIGADGDVDWDVPVKDIHKSKWADIEPVLMGRRNGRIMKMVTRITGYFGQLHNFNRSKKRETEDRRAGNYAVPEPKKKEATPA